MIKLVIFLLLISKSYAYENNEKKFFNDAGILSLTYHRFGEDKYPSTNVEMSIFKSQMTKITENNLNFFDPSELINDFSKVKKQKKILLTIDDAYESFYNNAWPYLKKNKIPFILFVSTEPVGKPGYMSWEQIKEVEKENFAHIGNHSHSHEYLLEFSKIEFENDINKSENIFEEKLGYNPIFFSYPFGEYSLYHKNYISKKFKFAFGQHSGVIDVNKDRFELPRFPINEKYGDLERFNFLIKLNPLEYKNILPLDKYILPNNNPPKLVIKFFESQENLEKINCFSDDGDGWNKTKILLENKKLELKFKDKFKFRRGRINCSVQDTIGWRWMGFQFSIKLD